MIPRRSLQWYAFLTPAFAFFLTFSVASVLFLLIVSFLSWDLLTQARFVGLENYRWVIMDAGVRTAVVNTAVFTALFVVPNFAISLLLALAANTNSRWRGVLRGLYFVPAITSISVVAIIWRWLLSSSPEGPLNSILAVVGIPAQPWISSIGQALPSLALMAIWASCGYYMLLWLTGLQSIPPEIIDASLVDGANERQRLRYVIVPMLRPTWFLILVISTLGSLKLFSHSFLLTGGGPVQATETIVFVVWKQAFIFQRMGQAAALAVVLLVLGVLISLVLRRTVEGDPEEGLR